MTDPTLTTVFCINLSLKRKAFENDTHPVQATMFLSSIAEDQSVG
jgi:hypothetical protein